MSAGDGSLQGQLLQLFLYLGAEWVLYLLLTLSVVSLAVALERAVHFVWRREDIDRLVEELEERLRDGDVEAARATLQRSRSAAAQVGLRGLAAMPKGAATAEEVMDGAAKLARLQMERGLAFLGTLGNNAPFIGLFGTVLGIIRAFRDLSNHTLEGSAAVMAGIAEALVATGVGLLVALPAVAVFNGFQRLIRVRLAGSEALAKTILAYAKAK